MNVNSALHGSVSSFFPSCQSGRSHSSERAKGKQSVAPNAGVTTSVCPSDNDFKKASALVDSTGRPVVLLRIFKRAGSFGYLPIFQEGEEIVGQVEFNFTEPEIVEGITLSAKGTITGLGKHQKVFVEVEENLWRADRLLTQINACMPSSSGGPGAQLKGYFNWPFSVKIPSHLAVTDERKCGALGTQFFGQLPPSFPTSDLHSSISYEVTLTVKGQARHDLVLSIPFVYMPISRPPSLSSVQDLARNNQRTEDTWEVFRSFVVRGIAFVAYNVDVICTFALARPLSYTRGTSIPCVLALECADAQTIELLASARAPVVRLCRCVDDASSGLELKITRILDAIKPPCMLASCAELRVADTTDMESGGFASAIRAIKTSLQGDLHSKILIGEIPLREDLTPSFSFARMSLKYEVQMPSLRTAGFVPEDGDKAVAFRTDVQIVSAPAIVEHMWRPPNLSPAPGSRDHQHNCPRHCRQFPERSNSTSIVVDSSSSSERRFLPNRSKSTSGAPGRTIPPTSRKCTNR
ncbi:hypothetical protein M0805_009882 [Coniferiporia weirii]|nr:hypothetical protein M0805_009882 [Coniferiporia weirii]